MPTNRLIYRHLSQLVLGISRDDWIRTSGLFVPNEARYRAALHPEKINIIIKDAAGTTLYQHYPHNP